MSRILLAWELGAGLGHLGPFFDFVPQLLERGHELHIAAREIVGACRVMGDLPVAVHQAPLCLNTYSGLQEPPLNYAEILMRYGYLDAAMLRAMLAAWDSLLRATQAELVIADHVPTALLAARLLGIPCAVIGSPFAVPPAKHPTPNMRAWLDVPAARLMDSDTRVLATINAALPAGAPQVTALHQIFDQAAQFFMGLPETDCYGPRECPVYLGLKVPGTGTATPAWPEGPGKRVFTYMHADYPHLDTVVRALASSGARVISYVGTDKKLLQCFQVPGMNPVTELVDMRKVLAEADLCVTHGMGTTLAAVGAGVALLMLPKQLENYLFAFALQQAGVGITVHPDEAGPDIEGVLGRLFRDDAYARNAHGLAERYREPSVGTIAAQVVARIEALAGSPQEKHA